MPNQGLRKAQLQAMQKMLAVAVEAMDSTDSTSEKRFEDFLSTIKAMAERPVSVSVKNEVAPSPAPVLQMGEGAIKVNVDARPEVTIAEGAIQSHTPVTVQQTEPGDTTIEYDNYGETGKPIRIRRSRR